MFDGTHAVTDNLFVLNGWELGKFATIPIEILVGWLLEEQTREVDGSLLCVWIDVNDLKQQLAALSSAHPMNMPTSVSTAQPVQPVQPVQPAKLAKPAPEDIVPDEITSKEDAERELIRRALERNNGNRKATAAETGFSERTLYRKISEYGL